MDIIKGKSERKFLPIMKNCPIRIFLFLFVFVCTLFFIDPLNQDNYMPALGTTEGQVYVYSENILLIEQDSMQELLAVNKDKIIYPASLTKIMTAIVALENVSHWNESFAVPDEIVQPLIDAQASMAGFKAGENVSVKDLLYGTLLSSGADGALTLAYGIAGNESSFVDLMNQKAVMLGMTHTHFTNATGLHDDNHVSTLDDLALLIEYAMDNPYFYQVFTSESYVCSPTKEHPKGLKLESTLFSKIEGESMILGGKTGYTPEAGLCLASLAQIEDERYLLLTANAPGNASTSPYHIADAMRIFNALKTRTSIE